LSALPLAIHQFRYDQRIFWRNPAAVGFTVMFPVIFLLLVGAIVGDQTIKSEGGTEGTTYIVAASITVALVSATMVNLAMSLTIAREGGILKRLRGTPLPNWAFVTGRIGNAFVISLLMTALVTAIGRVVFGVAVPWGQLPAILATLALGSACFCALGIALTTIIPSREAAPPITNLTVLPLYVISFIPSGDVAQGLIDIADAFPVRPLFELLLAGFAPGEVGSDLDPGNLAVVAAWGIVGLLVALRTFRWEPRAA
jgi:ABC-2 type transport system permease protein